MLTHADLLQGSGMEGRALDIYIRQHTSAYVSIRMLTCCKAAEWREEPLIYTYVSIRQHTSAYVSIRQHTHADLLQGSGVEGRALDILARCFS
jgi:hypothetical protein